MTSSLLQPAGSLGFPNMGQTPPIMAPGQMPTNTGVVPPPAATPAAPTATAAAPPQHQGRGRPDFAGVLARHPGFLDHLQARMGGGMMDRMQGRYPGLDMTALMARFGQPGAQPDPAATPAAAVPAPAGPVLNRPATII